MTQRGHGWFDASHLLPGEAILRAGRARLAIASAPYWWEGTLAFTTERVVFLADAENPLVTNVALWMGDIDAVARAGRNRLLVRAGDASVTFEVIDRGLSAASVLGRRHVAWLEAFEAARRHPHRVRRFDETPPPRRATG
jgi:hypothetical protein